MVEEDEEPSLTALDESDEVQELEGVEGSFLLFYNLFIILYICAWFFFFFLGKSFLPGSLGDGDVTRAIFLGLTACGLAAVPAVPAM